MLENIPRISRIEQATKILKDAIRAGKWSQWLPAERELATLLLISRNTLRAALSELARQGLISTVPGVGHRICAAPKKRISKAEKSVGFLIPGGLQSLRHDQLILIDTLRALLRTAGYELALHYQTRPPRNIRTHTCWMLMRCSAAIQKNFNASTSPAIVVGTPTPGTPFPSVDVDYRATCRHAIGRLFASGHRSPVMFLRVPAYEGDNESVQGFIDGSRKSPTTRPASIIRHDGSREQLCRILDRLMRSNVPPDSFLVSNPFDCLSLSSRLHRYKMPVTLISRDFEPSLNHLTPVPSYYKIDANAFARALLSLVIKIKKQPQPVSVRLFPDFIEGEFFSRLKTVVQK